MPPNQTNQYDFIMSNNQAPKRNLFSGGGMKIRIIAVVVIIIIFAIVATVVSSFLNKDAQAQKARLIEIAQTQNEINRVALLGTNQFKTEDSKNLAANAKLTAQSSQIETKRLLAKRGVKEKGLNKILGQKTNSKTDATLKEAGQNNRYDETFNVIMQKQLTDYQTLLKVAYENGTPNEKKILNESFESTAKLVTAPALSAPN